MYGSLFLHKLREHLEQSTNLACSGGVGSNKLLAKIGCGLNKPGKITVCAQSSVGRVSCQVPIPDIPGLGGNTGEKLMEDFGINMMHEISEIEYGKLESQFGSGLSEKICNWGIGDDNAPVLNKQMKDSIRCNKPSNRAFVKVFIYFIKFLSKQ
jgi:DNA polymerase eta